MFKRALRLLVIGYLLAALVGLALERAGAFECGCGADCWCKRPGLSLFRWVFPRGHRPADDPNQSLERG